ncbi:polyphosphate polymerase domain-containing protein [Candidatus Saccharibacteria bacterium]|nr:polyphosphate polymerase domain-containing protein [Candidatus Saccharibacteria bacterium]
MHEQVFDRVEKKYLITKRQKARILKSIKKHMSKDSYFRSEVYNLYFDNDNYDLIIQSIDRPEFKEKLRARSYAGYDRVFLELKTKLKGNDANIGYKRRVMITREDFAKFAKGHTTLVELVQHNTGNSNNMQIAKEIDYLVQYFSLKPKILIFYNRESYKDDNNLRVTFDEDLRFRDKNLSLIKGKRDKIYFKDIKNTIMEVKTQGALPLWLVNIMSAERIYPQQFSKIGKVYAKLINNKKGQNV